MKKATMTLAIAVLLATVAMPLPADDVSLDQLMSSGRKNRNQTTTQPTQPTTDDHPTTPGQVTQSTTVTEGSGEVSLSDLYGSRPGRREGRTPPKEKASQESRQTRPDTSGEVSMADLFGSSRSIEPQETTPSAPATESQEAQNLGEMLDQADPAAQSDVPAQVMISENVAESGVAPGMTRDLMVEYTEGEEVASPAQPAVQSAPNPGAQDRILEAHALLQDKEFEECIALLNDMQRAGSKDPSIFRMKAECYEALNQPLDAKLALSTYHDLIGLDISKEAHITAGELAVVETEIAALGAEAQAKRMRDRARNHIAAGNYRDALAELQNGKAEFDARDWSQDMRDAAYLIALESMHNDDTDTAAEVFSEMRPLLNVEDIQNLLVAYNTRLGQTAILQGDYAQGRTLLREARETAEIDDAFYNDLLTDVVEAEIVVNAGQSNWTAVEKAIEFSRDEELPIHPLLEVSYAIQSGADADKVIPELRYAAEYTRSEKDFTDAPRLALEKLAVLEQDTSEMQMAERKMSSLKGRIGTETSMLQQLKTEAAQFQQAANDYDSRIAAAQQRENSVYQSELARYDNQISALEKKKQELLTAERAQRDAQRVGQGLQIAGMLGTALTGDTTYMEYGNMANRGAQVGTRAVEFGKAGNSSASVQMEINQLQSQRSTVRKDTSESDSLRMQKDREIANAKRKQDEARLVESTIQSLEAELGTAQREFREAEERRRQNFLAEAREIPDAVIAEAERIGLATLKAERWDFTPTLYQTATEDSGNLVPEDPRFTAADKPALRMIAD